MVRTAAYVDGFNLYHGIRAKHGRKYLWLDLQALAESMIRDDQTLERVTYFTTRVVNDGPGYQRQSEYIEALSSHCPRVEVVAGRFQKKTRRCRQCGASWKVPEEKETDVSIAVALVEDAVMDRYDSALLVSADSDLCPAVRAVKRLHPDKRIVAAFPPQRRSDGLGRAADGFTYIGDDKIRRAQLPAKVITPAGVTLSRPAYWN